MFRYTWFGCGAFLVASFVAPRDSQLEFLILDVLERMGRVPQDPTTVSRILVPAVAATGATMMCMAVVGLFRK